MSDIFFILFCWSLTPYKKRTQFVGGMNVQLPTCKWENCVQLCKVFTLCTGFVVKLTQKCRSDCCRPAWEFTSQLKLEFIPQICYKNLYYLISPCLTDLTVRYVRPAVRVWPQYLRQSYSRFVTSGEVFRFFFIWRGEGFASK